jgi:hypothetical protein
MRLHTPILIALFMVLWLPSACEVEADVAAPPRSIEPVPAPEPTPRQPAGEVNVAAYPWLDPEGAAVLEPLEARFSPPEGFVRVAVSEGSFAAWLRGLPLVFDSTTVRSYDGSILSRPAAAVVSMDVGTRDLQQCADSAIRLHAEYLWHAGRADEAAYHFTSGHRTAWKDWLAGERFRVSGSKVERLRGSARTNTHATYRGWLDQVFMFAGTRSLAKHSDSVATDAELQAGDFFVQGGSPGHAVMILDIAEDAAGTRLALIGQGFMPAEDFHVLGWPTVATDGVWFELPRTEDGLISTPSWAPFQRVEAKRFQPQ